jgi:hypothetical protein
VEEDPLVREVKVVLTYNPQQNSFQSTLVPPADMKPEYAWEMLKLSVQAMDKFCPFYSDPVVRENIGTIAKSMKLLILGGAQAVAQARESQKNIERELR